MTEHDTLDITEDGLFRFTRAVAEAFFIDPEPELGRCLDCIIVDDVACQKLGLDRNSFVDQCFAHVRASMQRQGVSAIDKAASREREAVGWTPECVQPPPFLIHLLASALVGVDVEDDKDETGQEYGRV